jgi:cytochrome P450
VLQHEEWLRKYCGADGEGNMLVPMVVFGRQPETCGLVQINCPEDIERVTRAHVQKSRAYAGGLLGNGILSTLDLEQWAPQREDLRSAFLPQKTLRGAFPVTADRAEYAVGHMAETGEPTNRGGPDSDFTLNANEFFLYEAFAQLHLTMLGETAEFMDANNVKLRDAFSTLAKGFGLVSRSEFGRAKAFVTQNSTELVRRARDRAASNGGGDGVDSGANSGSGCPMSGGGGGPLGAVLATHVPHARNPERALVDTMTTFTFAGHDTTANMMTWCTFEVARSAEIQARLHREVDALAAKLGDRKVCLCQE